MAYREQPDPFKALNKEISSLKEQVSKLKLERMKVFKEWWDEKGFEVCFSTGMLVVCVGLGALMVGVGYKIMTSPSSSPQQSINTQREFTSATSAATSYVRNEIHLQPTNVSCRSYCGSYNTFLVRCEARFLANGTPIVNVLCCDPRQPSQGCITKDN